MIQEVINHHDPKLLTGFTANRKTISGIAKLGFSRNLQDFMLETLENRYYSLAVDSATAVGNEEYLAVSAKYLNDEEATFAETRLVGLLPLGSSTTGKTLFEKLSGLLFEGEKGEKRLQNLMGVAADRGSNMISSGHSSLTSRLKLQVSLQHLTVQHDLCHALNPALKSCVDSLPSKYTELLGRVCAFFADSPHRTSRFKEYLDQSKAPEEKIKTLIKYTRTQ